MSAKKSKSKLQQVETPANASSKKRKSFKYHEDQGITDLLLQPPSHQVHAPTTESKRRKSSKLDQQDLLSKKKKRAARPPQQTQMFQVNGTMNNLADTIHNNGTTHLSLETSEEEIVEQLMEYHPKSKHGTLSSLDNSPHTRKTVGFLFPDDLKSNDTYD